MILKVGDQVICIESNSHESQPAESQHSVIEGSVPTGVSDTLKSSASKLADSISEISETQFENMLKGMQEFTNAIYKNFVSGSSTENCKGKKVKLEFGVEFNSDISLFIVKRRTKSTLDITVEWDV